MSAIKPIILSCAGPVLTEDERAQYAAHNPFGFIVFRRNCHSPEQLTALIKSFRDCVGRADAPVLIDQEGGRVARLREPNWREFPAASTYAHLDNAAEYARSAGRLMGAQCLALGITVNCAPMVDLGTVQSHAGVIGDRVFGTDAATIAKLAGAYAQGLLDAGVLPIMKHIPGHGRATADSHEELPVVTATRDELREDFAPFKELNLPIAMTAHVQYTALDAENPATLSPSIIANVIRGDIGFDGLLMADTLEMQALSGTLTSRTQRAFAAGIDVALYCVGDLAGNEEVLQAAPEMTGQALARWDAAKATLPANSVEFDQNAYEKLCAAVDKLGDNTPDDGRIAGDSLVARL